MKLLMIIVIQEAAIAYRISESEFKRYITKNSKNELGLLSTMHYQIADTTTTTRDTMNNAYEKPHSENDVGDRIIKSLIAKWDLPNSYL